MRHLRFTTCLLIFCSATAARADWFHDFDNGIPETWEFFPPPPLPNSDSDTWTATVESGYLRLAEDRAPNKGGTPVITSREISETFTDLRVSADVNLDPMLGTFMGLTVENDNGAYLFGVETAPTDQEGTVWLCQFSSGITCWGSELDFGIPTRLDTDLSHYMQLDVVGNVLTGRVFDEQGGAELINISQTISEPLPGPRYAGVFTDIAPGFEHVPTAGTFDNVSAVTIPEPVALYDNVDNFRYDDDWLTPLGPDRKAAQQFLTRGNATIDQVTVVLTRPRGGATGSVSFELWHDDGSNRPMPVGDPTAKIVDIGTVPDVTQIPLGTEGEFTFDNLGIVVEPNSRYWVVLDNSKLENIGGGEQSVGWMANWSEAVPPKVYPPGYDVFAGTMGSAHAHVYRDADPFWADLAQVVGLDDVFFAMSVEATPIVAGPCDLNADGLCDVDDIDLLTAEILGEANDPVFDVTGDNVVDIADLNQWLSDAATQNGFVEAYLPGDADLDGSVDATDLNRLALNWQQNNSDWSGGDFTTDGVVDSADLNALGVNWRQAIPMASAVSVPEPSASLLMLFGLSLVRRRRVVDFL